MDSHFVNFEVLRSVNRLRISSAISMSTPERKSMSDKVGDSIMSSMKAVGSSVGKVGDSIVDGAKKVADVPGKVVDGVVDGAKRVSSFDRKKSKGASFSRLEEGKSSSSAGYEAEQEPPPAPADGGDIMSKMRASMPSPEAVSAKFDEVRQSLPPMPASVNELRQSLSAMPEKLEDRMTSKTLGTKLACTPLRPHIITLRPTPADPPLSRVLLIAYKSLHRLLCHAHAHPPHPPRAQATALRRCRSARRSRRCSRCRTRSRSS